MNNRSILRGAAIAVAISALLVSGCDDRNPNTPPAKSSSTFLSVANAASNEPLSHADRNFLKEAAVGGLFEVEAGQTGSNLASDAGVKSFAQMLMTEHAKTNDELKQLASSKQVEVGDQLPASMRRDLERMGKKSGKEFDREFVKEVGIKDHEKDIKLFEKAGKNAKDPDVRAWAQKVLPTLQQHLAEARRLASTLR